MLLIAPNGRQPEMRADDHITVSARCHASGNAFGTYMAHRPALYDFILGQNWRAAPVDSISDYLVARAHRRYGLTAEDSDVTKAWTLLQGSMYSQDVSVADFTGVKNLPGGANWVSVCEIYDACARARARVCENVCACVKMCVRVLLN